MSDVQVIDGTVTGELSSTSVVTGELASTYTVSGDISIAPGPIINIGLPPGGAPGDIVTKLSYDDYAAGWVTPASNAEEDNTRPITAAAVYTEIGNINALLATI